MTDLLRSTWVQSVLDWPWWAIGIAFVLVEGFCILLTWRDARFLPSAAKRRQLALSYLPLALIATARIAMGPVPAFAFVFLATTGLLLSIVVGSGFHPAILGTLENKTLRRRAGYRLWTMLVALLGMMVFVVLVGVANSDLISSRS